MLVTDAKTDALAEFLANGETSLDDVEVTLEKRASSRIVIGFFETSKDTNWLGDICTSEEFSEIRIIGSASKLDDATLHAFLKELSNSAIITGLEVSLCGIGPCCAAVFACSSLFNDPQIVAFDPPAELTPQGRGYVFYDPFVSKLAPSEAVQLKCIATKNDSLSAILRMRLAPTLLPAALRGELEPAFFYANFRARKNFRFYRLGMETALEKRGKAHRVPAFRTMFRDRLTAGTDAEKFDQLRTRAEDTRPDRPGAWARLRQAGDWPSAGGNIWMLQKDGARLRYLSDRWHGVTMGYVEQDGITLADTPDIALAFLGLGDGVQVERPLNRRFPWHVTNAQLDGTQPAFGPLSEATLACERTFAAHDCLFTTLGITQSQPGITHAEATRGGHAYDALLAQVADGQNALKSWNKRLHIDRVRLSLLTGAPQSSEAEAASHYLDVAQSLTDDLMRLTGQDSQPFIVVVPQAGSRVDGQSEIALAEGRLDLDALGLNVVVPTPAYPWPLMAGTPATASPEAALIMDELSALAVHEQQNGRVWHCPALQIATVDGRTVTAQFSTMDGLLLENGPHGFHLVGANAPSIQSAEVTGDATVRLELDAEVTQPGLHLAYAWGHVDTNNTEDRSANVGSLRDRWHHRSWAVKGETLRRFALPARVPLHLKTEHA